MNKKTLVLEDGTELVIVKPSPAQDAKGNIVRNKKFKEYADADVMVNEQLADMLQRKGLVSEEKQKKYEDLRNEVLELTKKLGKGKNGFPDLESAKKAAIEARRKRMDLRAMLMAQTTYSAYTAEAMAENDRFNYLLSQCVRTKDGKPYFDDVEDYLSRKDDKEVVKIAFAYAALVNEYDEGEDLKTVEEKFLKQYGFADEKGRLINKDGKYVDAEGRLTDADGKYINERGEFVDLNGNRVDEDGNYIQEDFEPWDT